MQILKELISIVTKVKLRSIRKLGFPFAQKNQLGEMYELLASGESEQDIALALTGKSEKTSTYRGLKADLSNRLIASLFLIDLSQPAYNSRQRAYYEVYKKWAAVKILMGKKARAASIDLAEQTYRQALRYEFNELALEIAKDLRFEFANLIGDIKKYQTYDEACQDLKRITAADDLAREYYARLVISSRQKKRPEQLVEEAEQAYASLKPYLAQSSAYTLHFYGGLIKLNIYNDKADHARILTVCDEMIHFFEQKTYTANVPLQVAYYQKLQCLFQLRKFEETDEFVERGLQLLQKGTYNWFKFQETYLLLALHSKQYNEAFRVYQSAVAEKRFGSLTEEVKEYWRILDAYLHWLLEIGELSIPGEAPRYSKFKIGRFLNQTPHFSKDKSGMNVSILVIQILFFVTRGKYHEITEKIDAIEQYGRRHLKSNTRAFYFIKALLELHRNAFHKVAVQRKASVYLERMAKHPLEETGSASFTTEIIPFETLWSFVESQLTNKFYKKYK